MRSWMSWPVLLRHLKPPGGMGGQIKLTSFRAGVKTEVQGWISQTVFFWIRLHSQELMEQPQASGESDKDLGTVFKTLLTFLWPNFFWQTMSQFRKSWLDTQSPVLPPSISFAQQGLDVSCYRIAFLVFTWHCLERVTRPRRDVKWFRWFGHKKISPPFSGRVARGGC